MFDEWGQFSTVIGLRQLKGVRLQGGEPPWSRASSPWPPDQGLCSTGRALPLPPQCLL